MTAGYIILGRPDWTRPQLAPEGDRLAAIRWHDGAANIWIGSSKSPMQLVTDLRPWRLRDFCWGSDGRGLALVLDDAGGRRRGLAWLDLRSGSVTRLTSELSADGRYAGQITGPKPRVLVSVRQPHGRGAVLQAVTTTGEVVGEWSGPGDPVSWWLATPSQAVAVCNGGTTCAWWHSDLTDQSWSRIAEFPATEAQASRPIAIAADSQCVYATTSAGRDTIALARMSGPEWQPAILSESEHFDVTSVLMAPEGGGPDLVTTTDPDAPQSALTDGAAADLSRLRHLAGESPARILDRNAGYCLAEISNAVGGPAYITFSRTSKAVGKPLVRYTGLSRVRMHSRQPFRFSARDGLLITGFLTRPAGPPPWPIVVVVHDGPWSRDEAHMDPWAQYLASAGFCCLQVNYRGSRGFGKGFRDAGDGQWSLAMQDDLVDALQSGPVAEVADTQRIAAMGHGYGGYASLMLATQPEVPITCVIAASAPTDLVQYTRTLLSFGRRSGYAHAMRIGEPVAERDKLTATSPMARAADIGASMLLFHGRQDACVPVSHVTSFADALRRAGKDHSVIIYEDEGHTYSRPQNVADFRLRTLEFLHTRLLAAGDGSGR
jgi:dipeptidyl aminopeptidase/acylaminoacyl peptidase